MHITPTCKSLVIIIILYYVFPNCATSKNSLTNTVRASRIVNTNNNSDNNDDALVRVIDEALQQQTQRCTGGTVVRHDDAVIQIAAGCGGN